jgi:hypothetical protein
MECRSTGVLDFYHHVAALSNPDSITQELTQIFGGHSPPYGWRTKAPECMRSLRSDKKKRNMRSIY